MIASRAARLVTDHALQIHGGQGYMKEARIEQFFRDAKVLDLFLESGQVGKNLIADGLTGKK